LARLIVISGPSGAGKGTLIARVLPLFDRLERSVSATTRDRRAGEMEGRDYHFICRGEFLRRVEQAEFLEWAEYGGNLYGTPAAAARASLDSGIDVILEIELQGARQVREHEPEAILVFIRPPSIDELEERLRLRGTDSSDSIARRMAHAREELDEASDENGGKPPEFDYAIVNDDVEEAAGQLQRVIEEIRAKDPTR
jgi:guanylate kinase